MARVKDAAEAHTTLVLFETACLMLEGSDVKGARARDVAFKVIRLLRTEQGRLLRDYDRAVASIEGGTHG